MMQSSSYIVFNSRDELMKVNLDRVVYFEADGNYTKIYLCNGLTGMVLASLGRIEELLTTHFPDQRGRFARIGKRFIINLPYIFRINILKQELTLSDQKTFACTVSVSRDALKKLKELLQPAPHKAPKTDNQETFNHDRTDYWARKRS